MIKGQGHLCCYRCSGVSDTRASVAAEVTSSVILELHENILGTDTRWPFSYTHMTLGFLTFHITLQLLSVGFIGLLKRKFNILYPQ